MTIAREVLIVQHLIRFFYSFLQNVLKFLQVLMSSLRAFLSRCMTLEYSPCLIGVIPPWNLQRPLAIGFNRQGREWLLRALAPQIGLSMGFPYFLIDPPS